MSGATDFVRQLAALDGLAPGLSEQQAADLCWALMDGHLYRLLVTERGWTSTQFTKWLSASVTTALLPPQPGQPTE